MVMLELTTTKIMKLYTVGKSFWIQYKQLDIMHAGTSGCMHIQVYLTHAKIGVLSDKFGQVTSMIIVKHAILQGQGHTLNRLI